MSRKITFCCDACKATDENEGCVPRSWLELQATLGDAASVEVCFCAGCKLDPVKVHRALFSRIQSAIAKTQELRQELITQMKAASPG